MGCAMSLIVFLATQVVKLPIKHFTSKIADEQKRRMTNATILLLPFIFGIALDILYSTFVLHKAFSLIYGLSYGTGAITLYGTVERFFKVKIFNPYDTEEGKAVKELVEKVVEDKKVDKKDKDAVKEFLKKIK